MRIPVLRCLVFSAVLLPLAAQAETQTFSAQIGGAEFVSDDDSISLVPAGNASGSFSLSASSKGASAWPPPKTPVDRLSIICGGLAAGQRLKLDSGNFSRAECDVRFSKGVKTMGGDPDAEYKLDKQHAGNQFEIERAEGKRYAGRFSFRLLDAAGQAHDVSGSFQAEDRQL
ncbi:hypothetical protein [Tahibacter harae]|uniref:Uncharacterized protein n=1 Tax=Tahibacter harae TaxID=2963937 RepID=A0ABT1QSI0_9GAMM|nr:hypothetical protein [Tahibacter harae]MCQ4165227.1 hypothetical protein [Tahibacter harae]